MIIVRIHSLVGFIALAAFLASGLYMHFGYNHLRGLDDLTRLLFRSSHIYLLFAALLNLALGLNAQPPAGGWRRRLRGAGSVLVLLAPVLLILAFLREPWLTGLDRPYAKPAIIGCLAGVLCHVASSVRAGRRSSDHSDGSNSSIEEVPPD
jgi:hypothetical protein